TVRSQPSTINHQLTTMNHPPSTRARLLRRGLLLVAAGIAWMGVEGGLGIAAAVAARSVALLGFGVDSVIEIASGLVVGWRLRAEARGACPGEGARVERRAGRVA